MAFADLKNDFVFRRIFASHPDILRGLLNDLLEREGERAIEGIEYLPSEQAPLVAGSKLSILDVKCRDRTGTTFVVEMQLLHMAGFVNRVVYNACKAYVAQIQKGDLYTKLADVVAVSICDFTLWPDAEQDEQQLRHVPMLSRWNMTERSSRQDGLLQVQYAFLELPKLPKRPPETGAELWAWLFVNAPKLTEVPAGLPPGPHREAVELAKEATFTQTELDAYQRVMDEIQQARQLAADAEKRGRSEGFAEGETSGFAKGETSGQARAILAVLAARGVAVDSGIRERITACKDAATLDRWIARAATAASAEEVIGSINERA